METYPCKKENPMRNQEEAAAVAAVLEYIKLYLKIPSQKPVNFRVSEKENIWAKAGRAGQMRKILDVQMKIRI